jgi:hypothetical protein
MTNKNQQPKASDRPEKVEPGIHLSAERILLDELIQCASCDEKYRAFNFVFVDGDEAWPACDRCAHKYGFSWKRILLTELP